MVMDSTLEKIRGLTKEPNEAIFTWHMERRRKRYNTIHLSFCIPFSILHDSFTMVVAVSSSQNHYYPAGGSAAAPDAPGTRKATHKFNVLQQHVFKALCNAPQPDPYTFILRCIYILPLLGIQYAEAFSHLLMCSLKRLNNQRPVELLSEAKCLASRLFLDILASSVIHDECILIKVLELFEIGLKDIEEARLASVTKKDDVEKTKAFIDRYIFDFIESQPYMTATVLVEHFSIYLGQSFLLKMMDKKQFKAAERWAMFMGKAMICLLVQKYVEMKMFKNAYDVIKSKNLKEEFPNVQRIYKERAMEDRQLLQFVHLVFRLIFDPRSVSPSSKPRDRKHWGAASFYRV
ncbi:hypothetical protein KSP40_PGU015903 [Platanthera guangdongensis]|uniref:Uncharacterized protein n=1 Tax=Platanthera guangdongensis TaxID=2320717 RepID=A0ABR2M9I8_9ASPA